MKYHNVSFKNVFLVFFSLFILAYLYSQSQDNRTTYVYNQIGSQFKFYDSSLYKNYTHEYVIEETKKFENRQTEEDDPELIEFVKRLIKPPSTYKYNFRVPDKKYGDYSQDGQSFYVDKLLKQRTNGFFIGMFLC